MGKPIRVLIADDDDLIRDSLADLITEDETLTLVGAAADADGAIALAIRTGPAVALLDVRMPGGGARASRAILTACPQTRIVAYTGLEERASAMEMIRAGAISYVLKGSPTTDILEAIHLAAEGRGMLASEVVPALLRELAAQLGRRDEEEAERELRTARIRREIDLGGSEVAFQPILDLRSGDLVGFEALTRFAAAPHRPPDAWFAEAADVGLLEELELTAVRQALHAALDLPKGAYVSVNLSPRTFVSARGRAALAKTAPGVVVEITEHAPVGDYDELDEAIQDLRRRGGRLAVDDAGAGFASLRHILRLAPDIIKLDVSLTRDIHVDSRRRALAASMISFAAELGADIVAEGIETGLELEALRALEVSHGQGFFLGRPAPVQEVTAQLATQKRTWALPASLLNDRLTGLRDRPAFLALGQQALALAGRLGQGVTLLVVRVENLEDIAARLGPDARDLALQDVAHLLTGTLRASDIVARLGPDEFGALLMADTSPDGGTPASNLMERLATQNETAGRPYLLAISICVATRDRPGAGTTGTVEDLLRRARGPGDWPGDADVLD